MESNLGHQTCVSACVGVCVHVLVCASPVCRYPLTASSQREGERKQASSPLPSNYKWQTCNQESVWHLTTHDNLSALCRYTVTGYLWACVCVCAPTDTFKQEQQRSNSLLPYGPVLQWQSKKPTANILPNFHIFLTSLPFQIPILYFRPSIFLDPSLLPRSRSISFSLPSASFKTPPFFSRSPISSSLCNNEVNTALWLVLLTVCISDCICN